MSPSVATGQNPPLVSVAICTFNRAWMLRESIPSVLAQTLSDFELLICDDGSTDDTPAVCDEFARHDARVKVIRHARNIGMVRNWQSALCAARGRWFAKLDDDNRYLPQFLEGLISSLNSAPETGLAFCDEWIIDARGARSLSASQACSARYFRSVLNGGAQPDLPLLAARQSVGINAAVISRELALQVGGFREAASAGADTDLFLRLAAHGCRATYVPQRLSEYRVHDGQTTNDLPRNLEKARASAMMWESVSFGGRAERARRIQVSRAYLALARVLLSMQELRAARDAVRRATRVAPWRFKALAARVLLALPPVLHRWLLRKRYRL